MYIRIYQNIITPLLQVIKIQIRINYLIIFLIFVHISIVSGQEPYNAKDHAGTGDNFVVGQFTNSSDTLVLEDFGDNPWDFSALTPSEVDTLYYIAPERLKSSDSLKSPNLALKNTAGFTRVLHKSNEAIREIGHIGDYLNIDANIIINFPDRMKLIQFPIQKGQQYKTQARRNIVVPYYFVEGTDSIRKNYEITRDVEVNESGTVSTPYGTFNAILEVTTRTTICKGFTYDSFGWHPSDKHTFKRRRYIYRWYSKSSGHPVVQVYVHYTGYITKIIYRRDLPLSSKINKTDVTCYQGSNGEIDLNPEGGVPGYDIQWSNGATSDSLTDLKAGTYTVKITDNKDSITHDTVTIKQPAQPLTTNLEVTPESCFGEKDGAIKAVVENGTPPFKFAWSTGSEEQEIKNLNPGTYSVKITDANGCTVKDTAKITGPENPLTLALKPTNNICKNGNDGKITTRIRGGTPPYHYNWTSGDTIKNPDNLTAGTYKLTATDAHGCTITERTRVDEPNKALKVNIEHNDIPCPGWDNGNARVNIKGGTPGYSIKWSTGESAKEIEGLRPGHYSVSITDELGCTKKTEVTISEPQPLQVKIDKTHPLKNYHNGRISLCPKGGNPPYTALWNNGYDSLSRENLTPGIYQIMIRDNNNCPLNVVTALTEKTKRLLLPGELKHYVTNLSSVRPEEDIHIIFRDNYGNTFIFQGQKKDFSEKWMSKLKNRIYHFTVFNENHLMHTGIMQP